MKSSVLSYETNGCNTKPNMQYENKIIDSTRKSYQQYKTSDMQYKNKIIGSTKKSYRQYKTSDMQYITQSSAVQNQSSSAVQKVMICSTLLGPVEYLITVMGGINRWVIDQESQYKSESIDWNFPQ